MRISIYYTGIREYQYFWFKLQSILLHLTNQARDLAGDYIHLREAPNRMSDLIVTSLHFAA